MDVLLYAWPLLLVSPLIFLVREVRKSTALQVTALAIVGACYLVLLFEVVPAIIAGVVMVVADKPTRDFVINRDQTLAGIRFPKGSRVSTLVPDGRLSQVVLSEDIEIDGIPAGKGTPVLFGPGGNAGWVTTGRAWSYREIPVPAGSLVSLSTSGGVHEIVLSASPAEVLNVDDMLIHGVATLNFDGDKLRSLFGHYVWRGKHYRSYKVGVDGQIQRQPE